MNFIEEAEKLLFYYNDLNRSVENLDREINKLIQHQAPDHINTMLLEITGVRSKMVEDTYDSLFRIKILTESKERTQYSIQQIDQILDELSQTPGRENYGQLLREWYINQTPKDEIAEILGYATRRTVYRIKEHALQKFAIRYYGLDAMMAI